jgi:hypothetical protein
MHWVIIVGLVVLAVYIIQKFVHLSHWNSKFWMITIIVLLGFVALSFFGVVKVNSVNLNTTSGFFSAVRLYFSWLVHAFSNIKAITGNVMKLTWFPNATAG